MHSSLFLYCPSDVQAQPFILDLEENAQQLAACTCRNSALGEGLPLFGEHDHADADKVSEASNESGRKIVACSYQSLLLRSMQLCTFFAPFLCFGVMLLLFAAIVRKRNQNIPRTERDQQPASTMSTRGVLRPLVA